MFYRNPITALTELIRGTSRFHHYCVRDNFVPSMLPRERRFQWNLKNMPIYLVTVNTDILLNELNSLKYIGTSSLVVEKMNFF